MGASNSQESYLNDRQALIDSIQEVASGLLETYTTKFLDKDFCDSLALTYTDQLVGYSQHELNGVAMRLGVKVNEPEMKETICAEIVEHYKRRNEIVAMLQASISYCSDRIFALTTGPRCEGAPEVFEQNECAKSGGRWIPMIVPPDESLDQNTYWYQNLYGLEEAYLSGLLRVLEILQELRDYAETLTNDRLQDIAEESKELIDNMQGMCYNLYKLALTTPTVTPSELDLMAEQEAISKQEAAAREAAIRASRGLPPVAAE